MILVVPPRGAAGSARPLRWGRRCDGARRQRDVADSMVGPAAQATTVPRVPRCNAA